MSPENDDAPRPYRKRRRAQAEQRTRLRITEAAMELHGSVGPARTTVSAVAKRAGVQRATVYRHFPTEEDLFVACSTHWLQDNLPPDPQAWSEVADPAERLRHALGEVYAWYRNNEEMLERTSRDAPLVAAMAGPVQGMLAHLDAAAAAIMAGRPERGTARKRARAAVGHAITFSTWQSLIRQQGLDDREAVALMAAMVEA